MFRNVFFFMCLMHNIIAVKFPLFPTFPAFYVSLEFSDSQTIQSQHSRTNHYLIIIDSIPKDTKKKEKLLGLNNCFSFGFVTSKWESTLSAQLQMRLNELYFTFVVLFS